MDQKIETFRSIQLVNGHHEAVLVLVADFNAVGLRLREETRVVGDYVPGGLLVQPPQVLGFDNVYCVGGVIRKLGLELLDLPKNLVPIRHLDRAGEETDSVSRFGRNDLQRGWLIEGKVDIVIWPKWGWPWNEEMRVLVLNGLRFTTQLLAFLAFSYKW